jgi:hypothetical protein
LLPILAALLIAATDPAPAEASAAPPSEALIDRFMAVIPEAQSLREVNRTADPAQLARLARINPGKEDVIRPVLEAYSACASPINNAMTLSGLRFAAQRLGSTRLEQLIRFYQSEDLGRLGALVPRLQAGETLPPADQTELERILAAYPVMELHRVMTEELPEFFASQTERLVELNRCAEEKDAALARLDVDTVGPVFTVVAPSPRDPNSPEVSCGENAERAEPGEGCSARRRRQR